MTYREVMDEVRQRTAPAPDAVARVRERLDLQLRPATAELSALPSPDPAAVARVRARLRAPEPRRTPWALPVGGLALAALALVVARFALAPAEPVAVELVGVGSLTPTADVRATHDGLGTLTATGEVLDVDWQAGRITFDVTPDRGVRLAVRTPEGVARVVGTRFTVERDALGTRVEVERGTVSVTCAGHGETRVGGGSETECLPITAAGWLARANALSDRGATPDQVLAAADTGLRLPVEGPLRSELGVARMRALLAAGRDHEALLAAEAALVDAEEGRAGELHRAAAALALTAGDCRRALPHLSVLPDPTADEAAHLARCAGAP